MAPSPFLLLSRQVTQQVTKQVTLLGCHWDNIDRRIAEILITGVFVGFASLVLAMHRA